MATITMFLVGWCGVFGLLFGCPESRGPGWVEAQTQMHSLEQQTDQMQIQAEQQTDQMHIDAKYQAEQQRIDAQRQANELQAQTEQQRIMAHATAEAMSQREESYRTEVLQTAATERLYKAEMERTLRLRLFLRFLSYLVAVAVALYAATLIADHIRGQHPPRVELPPPTDAQPMGWPEFWQAAEQLPYDIVQDKDGRVFGVLYMNGAPVMKQLPGDTRS